MTENTITPAAVRVFCAKHAFKIGNTFKDTTLTEWLDLSKSLASRSQFKSYSERHTWQLAFVCRECCDSPADGPDRLGVAGRHGFYKTFDDMMLRHQIG